MVLVLCISDLHIPHRAADLPPRFKELLQPGKITHILCPGNLCCRETYDFLKSVSANLHLTKGDFDDIDAPEDKVINIESFKIGICHGHQVVPCGDVEALAILQRRLDADILVTGHTHKFMVQEYENRLLMNPGSATGAYCIFEDEVTPSFILMDITGPKVDVYIYQMIDGDSKVKKLEFVKPAGRGTTMLESASSAAAPLGKVMDSSAPLDSSYGKTSTATTAASAPMPSQPPTPASEPAKSKDPAPATEATATSGAMPPAPTNPAPKTPAPAAGEAAATTMKTEDKPAQIQADGASSPTAQALNEEKTLEKGEEGKRTDSSGAA